ncbi:uncharacterized protein [Mytilus edulis]|uniref:uncharacterized protein n=1 Tax=Mytilus edulis TaxID=6550 RepID=UPI0039EE5CA5
MGVLCRFLGFIRQRLYATKHTKDDRVLTYCRAPEPPARRTRFLQRFAYICIYGGLPFLKTILQQEVNKLQEENKYVLVGEKDVTRDVKKNILRERKIKTSFFVGMLYKLDIVDIQIIKEQSQYDALEREGKPFQYLLCVSADKSTDQANTEYCLPSDIEDLQPNISLQHILIVFKEGVDDDKMRQCKQSLGKNAEVIRVFRDPNIKSVSLTGTIESSNSTTDKAIALIFFATIFLNIIRI